MRARRSRGWYGGVWLSPAIHPAPDRGAAAFARRRRWRRCSGAASTGGTWAFPSGTKPQRAGRGVRPHRGPLRGDGRPFLHVPPLRRARVARATQRRHPRSRRHSDRARGDARAPIVHRRSGGVPRPPHAPRASRGLALARNCPPSNAAPRPLRPELSAACRQVGRGSATRLTTVSESRRARPASAPSSQKEEVTIADYERCSGAGKCPEAALHDGFTAELVAVATVTCRCPACLTRPRAPTARPTECGCRRRPSGSAQGVGTARIPTLGTELE